MDLSMSELKIRESKKWKERFCILQRPSQDQLILLVYKSEKNYRKAQQPKEILTFEDYFGVESGFLFERESYTLAIICAPQIVIVAFDTQETLVEWEHIIRKYLGQSCQFRVQIVQTPADSEIAENSRARLHVHDGQFGLVADCPPRLTAGWHFDQIRRYGPLHNKFCFELASSVGKGPGMYVLLSSQNDQIAAAFSLASKNVLNLQLVKSSRLPYVGNLHQIDESAIDGSERNQFKPKDNRDELSSNDFRYRQRKSLTRVPFRSETDVSREYHDGFRHLSYSPVEIPYKSAAQLNRQGCADGPILKQKLRQSRSGGALEILQNRLMEESYKHSSNHLDGAQMGSSSTSSLNPPGCNCDKDKRGDYINQEFIDSLKHYYNIDKVVLSVSHKQRCCEHNCTSPPPPIANLIRCRPAAVELQMRNSPPPQLPPRRNNLRPNDLPTRQFESEIPPDPVITSKRRSSRTDTDGIDVDMEVLSVVTKVKSPLDRSTTKGDRQRKLRSSETDLTHFSPAHNSPTWSYFRPPHWRSSIALSDTTANRDLNDNNYADTEASRFSMSNYPYMRETDSSPNYANYRKSSDFTAYNSRPQRSNFERPKSPRRKFSMPTLNDQSAYQFGSVEDFPHRFPSSNLNSNLNSNSNLRGSANSLLRSGSAKVKSFVSGFVRGAFGSAVNLSHIDKPDRSEFFPPNFPIHTRCSSYSTPFGFRDSFLESEKPFQPNSDELDEIRDDVFLSLPRQFARNVKIRQPTEPFRHSELSSSARNLSGLSDSVRVRSDNRHHSRLRSSDQFDLSPVRSFPSPTRKFSNSFSVSGALDSIHEVQPFNTYKFPPQSHFGATMSTGEKSAEIQTPKRSKFRPKNLDSITKPICGESFDRYDTPNLRDSNFVDWGSNQHQMGQLRARKSASVNFNFSNLADKSAMGPTVTPSVAQTVGTAKTLLERRLTDQSRMQMPMSAGWQRHQNSNFFKFPDRLDNLDYLELDRSDGSSNVSTPRSPAAFRPAPYGPNGTSVDYTDVDIVATVAAQKVSQDRSEEREKFSEMSRSSSAASLNHSDSSAPSATNSKAKRFRKKFTSSLLDRSRIKSSSMRRTSLSSLTESN